MHQDLTKHPGKIR
jgi:hypothetical protein